MYHVCVRARAYVCVRVRTCACECARARARVTGTTASLPDLAARIVLPRGANPALAHLDVRAQECARRALLATGASTTHRWRGRYAAAPPLRRPQTALQTRRPPPSPCRPPRAPRPRACPRARGHGRVGHGRSPARPTRRAQRAAAGAWPSAGSCAAGERKEGGARQTGLVTERRVSRDARTARARGGRRRAGRGDGCRRGGTRPHEGVRHARGGRRLRCARASHSSPLSAKPRWQARTLLCTSWGNSAFARFQNFVSRNLRQGGRRGWEKKGRACQHRASPTRRCPRGS